MNILQNFNRIEKLHQLILAEKTGSPVQLAKQLGISRATLYVLIDELNSLNIKVAYSRKYETFYYEKKVEMTIQFKIEMLDSDELNKFNGGSLHFFLPSDLSDGRNLSLHSYLAEYKESAHRLVSWEQKMF